MIDLLHPSLSTSKLIDQSSSFLLVSFSNEDSNSPYKKSKNNYLFLPSKKNLYG